MTRKYEAKIGELTRKGRTVYYAFIEGNRDLRARDGAARFESYDRSDVVRALESAGVFDL